MTVISSVKEETSKYDVICKWINTNIIPEDEPFSGAIAGAKEFKFMLLEERKAFYRQGKIVHFVNNQHCPILSSFWRKSEDFFLGLSGNDVEIRRVYYLYIEEIKKQGRSIEDIYMIEPILIYEIAGLEDYSRFEEFEKFVLNNKVGGKNLRQMVKIINENNDISIEVALDQLKKEAKAKREDIKSGSVLERRYKKLKKMYKCLDKCCDNAWQKHKESEKLRRKFQHRSEKWSKLNAELNEQIKTIRKALRTKFLDINEIKNIVGIDDKKYTEQETKNNIIPEIINKVKYYPMVIKDSHTIT